MLSQKLPKSIWQYNPKNEDHIPQLSEKLDLPLFVAAVLCQRNLSDPEAASRFLKPVLSDLHDPFLLNDMDRAINRIIEALRRQEKILVCGDYDVDGITSVALLKRTLPTLGADIAYFLPNRLEEGYGFHESSVNYAREIGAKLIITVDCGISAQSAVVYARELGIDVIITDHHEPNGPLPGALAIVNPKRPDSTYPDPNLAGIGVAFKVVQALMLKGILQFPLHPLLELVALGTVADVAHLLGENRIFVYHGLESLAHTNQPGIKALMRVSGVAHGRELDPYAIGFQLGPRLNAVGRLGSPQRALELLLATSEEQAEKLALELNSINQKRQAIEEEILKLVETEIAAINLDHNPFIVVSGPEWHEGVIGIVASKITDRYYRPSCIISVKNGIGRGSGRSIPSFSLFDCLTELKSLLIEFGGHQVAAGFQIPAENIASFRENCQRVASEKLQPSDLIPKTEIDAQVTISDLTFDSIRAIQKLSPFGLGNPKPRFLIRNLKNRFPPRAVGSDGNHLKLVLTNGNRFIDAIAFGFGKNAEVLSRCKSLDIVATPEINLWNGRELIQLQIHDILPCMN